MTQILTHTGHGRGFPAPVPLFFFWFSDGSRQHLPHGICRLPLGLGGHMGVGIQGEPGGVVALIQNRSCGKGLHIGSRS